MAILDASPVGVALDDAMYVILAKSLATGQGYRYLNLPGAPAGTHFPPGYPALLALLWRVAPDFPGNLMLFKAVNALWLAVATVAVARFARRRLLPDGWSLAAGALTAVSAPLLFLGALLMSEPFFLALLLLLLPHLEEFVDRTGAGRPAFGQAALLGAAIGIGMLVRTHAIALVPAVALVLVLRRRWREAAVVAAVAICVILPWQLWTARHANDVPAPLAGEYGSYLAWWVRGYRYLGPRMIPMTLERSLGGIAGMFAIMFNPWRTVAGNVATLAALAIVFTAGVAAQWRRIPVTLLFLGTYLGIIVLWPFPSSRFVWSVWPLVLLLLLGGAHRIAVLARAGAGPRGRRIAHLAAAAAVLWIAAGYAAYERRAIAGRWWQSIPRDVGDRIVPAVRWTLANTAPSDVVATDDEGAVYLYTGRLTVPIRSFTVQQYLTPLTVPQDAATGLLPILDRYPVRTVVVGSVASLAVAEWLAAQPRPRVARREAFHEGAAFTVLRQ